MSALLIHSDAFAHSQVKSKLWLARHFQSWIKSEDITAGPYTLNWYGSWIGLGPFVFMTQNPQLPIKTVNLYDLNATDLEVSRKILNMWECDLVHIRTHTQDVNEVFPAHEPNQIFINTSCEHILSNEWLARIPSGSPVILQSTNMPHIEHINCPESLNHFQQIYSAHIDIKETHELNFSYPDKTFSRFMLLGLKK